MIDSDDVDGCLLRGQLEAKLLLDGVEEVGLADAVGPGDERVVAGKHRFAIRALEMNGAPAIRGDEPALRLIPADDILLGNRRRIQARIRFFQLQPQCFLA